MKEKKSDEGEKEGEEIQGEMTKSMLISVEKVDLLKKKFARSEWEQKSVQFDPTKRA